MKLPDSIPIEIALRACLIAEERMCRFASSFGSPAYCRAFAQKYPEDHGWTDGERETAEFCVKAAVRGALLEMTRNLTPSSAPTSPPTT